MPGSPSATDLLDAVRAFIAGLQLDGRDAFHAKVAGNVLAIVARELAQRPDVAEAIALKSLDHAPHQDRHTREGGDDERGIGDNAEGGDGCVGAGALSAEVCAAIRSGALTVATPGLLDALIGAMTARLAVDNPRYSTLARLTGDTAPER